MSTPVCRVCLVSSLKMISIENILLRKFFELLKGSESDTEHGADMMCYICYSYLKRCYTFSQMVQRSDVILKTLIDEGFEATQESLTNIDTIETLPILSVSTITYMSTDVCDNTMSTVKQESIFGDKQMMEVDIGMDGLDYTDDEEISIKNELFNVQSVATSKETTDSVCYDDEHDKTEHQEIEKLDPGHVSHTSLKNKFKRFTCKECNQTFAAYSSVIAHMRVHIGENLTTTLSDESDLHKHKGTTVHNNVMLSREVKIYTCKQCDKTFTSKRNFYRHIDTHSDKTYENSCEKCGKLFASKENLQIHLRTTHSDERPFPCAVCAKAFKLKKQLKEHFRIHTGEKPFACDVCKKQFTQSSSLRKHKTIHSSQMIFICDLCGRVLKTKRTLEVHMLIHNDVKAYACNRCDKTFNVKKNLSRHVKTHAAKTYEHTCEVCGKMFSSVDNMRYHIRMMHMQVKMFACPYCGKAFKRKIQLNEHIRIHTKERPYACDECGMTFTQSSSCNIHKTIHSALKPYTCDLCDVKFRHKQALITHIRVHTGEKKYACDKCDKSYVANKSLHLHRMRSHGILQICWEAAEKQSVKCHKCFKLFTSNKTLRIHMMRFHDAVEKPFSCDECAKTFALKCDLKRHYIKKHGKTANIKKHQN